MPFNLEFPTPQAENHRLQLNAGEVLFVLGANGTGKSSLIFRFSSQHRGRSRRISAHRQTWMNSDTLDMTASAKLQTERQIQNVDQNTQSRYRDEYAAQRASLVIYDLIDAENVRARAMAAAYDAGDQERLERAASAEAPVAVINELLQQSNLPIAISIRANEQVMASKNAGDEYSAAQLSDGERNALLIAGNVLTAQEETLLIIDEPERHLHRSIIAPLLRRLFERRPDCGFVISTHDHDLPLAHPEARTLLLRSCRFNGPQVRDWAADELPAGCPIDDNLKRDLLGARRTILFVEGTESSLDKSLYSIVFPMASIVPKGSCQEVERAVAGARAAASLHWLSAFGLIDSDGLAAEEIEGKRESSVYATPYYSVEAVYYHPEIIGRIAAREASAHGGDAERLLDDAVASGVAAISTDTERLSRNAAKKMIQRAVMEGIPNDDDLLGNRAGQLVIALESETIHRACRERLDLAVGNGDWETIVTMCPVRESRALSEICSRLRFRRRSDYERAVRHLLSEEEEARQWVRELFGDLATQILKPLAKIK